MSKSAPKSQEWHLTVDSSRFVCSTNPDRIQHEALNKALSSDALYWATELNNNQLTTLVNNSLCLGIYDETDAGTDAGTETGRKTAPMVGFARLVTDRVTFAYLTDVYVLEEYQRRGLGKWLMQCLRDHLVGESDPETQWTHLRSLWLIASTPHAAKMYMNTLIAEEVARYRPTPGDNNSGLIMLEMPGPANGLKKKLSKEQ